VGVRSATRGVRRLAGRPYTGPPDRAPTPADPTRNPTDALEAAANEAQDGSLLRRAQDGDSAALRELAETTGATENASVRGALAADEANEAVGQVRPEGVSEAEHMERIGQALEALVSEAPPPGNASRAPMTSAVTARGEAGARLANDTEPPKTGSTIEIEGKPVTYRSLDPQNIEADPDVFQFKSGGDAYGVTRRLRGVRRWDALSSSKAVIFERADGQLIVADGHQRLGLAKRLMADPRAEGETPTIDGYVFREADGWTASDVSAFAAAKNMREQSGSSLDMAKMIRARPDLVDDSMPLTDRKMKEAVALSKLEDSAFDMVIGGVVPAHYGALVGDRVADPSRHAGLLRDMLDAGAQNEQQARLTLGQLLATPTRTETQETLFGSETFTRSLMPERVRVLDSALKELRRDRRVFGLLEAEARRIEGEGNVLARDANVRQAEAAAKLAELIESLSTRTGMVSDLLNEAAKSVANGVRTTTAAKGLVSKLSDVLEREGLAGLDRRLREAPEPERIDDPSGPEAQAQTDRLDPMFAIRAFHGSPHDFDRFDMSRIGTGEGTQYEGHGLYFTDLVEVARGYQHDLTGGTQAARVDGEPFVGSEPSHIAAFEIYNEGSREAALAKIASEAATDELKGRDGVARLWRQAEEILRTSDDENLPTYQPPGRLYEVEIDAEPEDFLWDVWGPDQPEGAIERLIPVARKIKPDFTEDELRKFIEERSGSEIYFNLADAMDGSPAKASEELLKAGFPGLRYSDNYVVFDDSIIKIVAKDGKPVSGTERADVLQQTQDQFFALRAFHGSPHRFDRFDISRIGTGEGHQAFGHGLYFAQNPKVAVFYRHTLAGGQAGKVDGAPFDPTNPQHLAARQVADHGTRERAIDNLEQEASGAASRGQDDVAQRSREAAEFLRTASDDDLPEFEHPGHIYEVRIDAEEEDLLDWDAPLREQPGMVEKLLPLAHRIQRDLYDLMPEDVDDALVLSELQAQTGAEFYEELAQARFWGGRDRPDAADTAASQTLREAGVPGIRYLDSDSRFFGDGTRNIVMFSDDLIEIVRRDGKPVSDAERA
ncbi:MAG: hypothetical protein ACOC9P_02610, partial [bacterium]